jgi:hypothetical protein
MTWQTGGRQETLATEVVDEGIGRHTKPVKLLIIEHVAYQKHNVCSDLCNSYNVRPFKKKCLNEKQN